MKKLLLAGLISLGVVIGMNVPDIKRYLAIRRM